MATTALITVMFGLADFLGEKEIIFPEISALALGFWIMDRAPWQGSPLAVWLSPTLAALTGVLLQRYIPWPPIALIGTALVAIIIFLQLLRSEVFPAISAAVLAIITQTSSWLYPLSVALLMTIIVLGKYGVAAFGPRESSDRERIILYQTRQQEIIYWGKVFVTVIIISTLALSLDCLYIIAPPLIVAFIELSRPEQPLRRAFSKAILILFLAAGSGALCYYLTVILLGAPLWLFGGLSLSSVFLWFRLLKAPFPPAAAIALLPALVAPEMLWLYPLQVLAGSCLFVVSGLAFFKSTESRDITSRVF